MRIWTVHPQYLDSKGLVALWRETLLAQKVLAGNTNGYRNHPQLDRFKACNQPIAAIGAYLTEIYEEAVRRGYNFNRSKILEPSGSLVIKATDGQLAYEWQHLLRKLQTRDNERFRKFNQITTPEAHPVFTIVPGAIQDWEKIT